MDYPNTIFLHADGNDSLLGLVGHEWLHSLKLQDTALYKDLQRKLIPLVDSWRERTRELSPFYDRKVRSEELTANIVQDAFSHPNFWRHVSEKDQPLFQRLLSSVKDWFSSFSEKVRASDNGTEKALKDIDAVHAAIMSTLERAGKKSPYPEPKADVKIVKPDPMGEAK